MPIVLASDDAEVATAWERGHSAFALRRAETLDSMLDATAFWLHRGEAAMSEPQRRSALAARAISWRRKKTGRGRADLPGPDR